MQLARAEHSCQLLQDRCSHAASQHVQGIAVSGAWYVGRSLCCCQTQLLASCQVVSTCI